MSIVREGVFIREKKNYATLAAEFFFASSWCRKCQEIGEKKIMMTMHIGV